MNNYKVFLKKELVESLKTFKLLIMGGIFLLLGMMGPLMAKYTPEILKWAIESDPSLAGMNLSAMIAQPTAFESWSQFYSNVGQLGYIALVVLFSGMLSSEISRGALKIMLSKGLSRSAVVLSKFTSSVLVWTGSFCLSALVSLGLTSYLFDDGVSALFFTLFCLWVFGVLLLALTTLMAALTNRSFVCMFAVGGVVVVMSLVELLHFIKEYVPMALISTSRMLLINGMEPGEFVPALVTAGVLVVVFILLAVWIFGKKSGIRDS